MESEETWVESYLGHPLSDFQRRCTNLLCKAFAMGPYNIHTNWKRMELHERDVSLVISNTELATFDFDKLTRLVIGAHDESIRISISACAPNRLRLRMHERQKRKGRMYERHPTIEQAIEAYRQ